MPPFVKLRGLVIGMYGLAHTLIEPIENAFIKQDAPELIVVDLSFGSTQEWRFFEALARKRPGSFGPIKPPDGHPVFGLTVGERTVETPSRPSEGSRAHRH